MAFHDLLSPARPSAPVAHGADFHVNDDAPSGKPVTSDETPTGAQLAGVAVNSRPVIALILVLGLLFSLRVLKDVAHHAVEHDHSRFREVDITLWNVLIVSLLAIPGIVMWKFFTQAYLHERNPFRTLVAAV